MHSSSSSPTSGGGGSGGCPCFGVMVSKKEGATQIGYRLVKTKYKTKGGSTLSSILPRSYEFSTYTASGNRWPCENQKSMG
jgi:hypothetical protein